MTILHAQFDGCWAWRESLRIYITSINATMVRLASDTARVDRNLFVGDLLREGPEKRWILLPRTMWGGCKLSCSGNRFLGAIRSRCWGTQTEGIRLITSAGECHFNHVCRAEVPRRTHRAGRLFCAGAEEGGWLSLRPVQGHTSRLPSALFLAVRWTLAWALVLPLLEAGEKSEN